MTTYMLSTTLEVGEGATLEFVGTSAVKSLGLYTGSKITGAGTFKVGSGTTTSLMAATVDIAKVIADSTGTLQILAGTTTISSDMSSFAGNISVAASGKLAISSTIGSKDTKAAGVTFASGAKLFLTEDWLAISTISDDDEKVLTIICASAISVAGTALSNGDVTTELASVAEYASVFDDYTKVWSYNDGALILTLTAIPEPSFFGLLAGTLALALAGTRRRRKRS